MDKCSIRGVLTAILLAAITTTATRAALIIDDFSVPQAPGTTYVSPGGIGAIMGGIVGTTRVLSAISDPWHTLKYDVSTGTLNYWSFGGFEPWSVAYTSPSSINLADPSLNAFQFGHAGYGGYGGPSAPLVIKLEVDDTIGGHSEFTGTFPGPGGLVPFASFVGNVDWSKVETVQLTGVSGDSLGYWFYLDEFSAAVPEPSSAILLVIGSLVMSGYGWRNRSENQPLDAESYWRTTLAKISD